MTLPPSQAWTPRAPGIERETEAGDCRDRDPGGLLQVGCPAPIGPREGQRAAWRHTASSGGKPLTRRSKRRPKRVFAVPGPSLPGRVFEADCPSCGLPRPPCTPGPQTGRAQGVGSLGRPQNPYWNLYRLEQGGNAALRKQGKLRPRGRRLPGASQLTEGVLRLTLEASDTVLPSSLSMAIRSAPRPTGAGWGRAT